MPELVVLVEQLLAPVPGGTGRYTRELASALAATAPAEWMVSSAVARHADPSAAVIPGVDGPKVLPLSPRALAYAWERGWRFWPGGDTVHAPTPFAPPRSKRGRGLVVTVHDTVPWTHPDTLTRRGAHWHRKVVARATYQADAIIVPTYAVAAELTQHAPGTVRVHVIGHGVPAALTEPPDMDANFRIRSRLKLPERYVLAIGTIEPRKGLDVLVDAMSRPTAPDLPLVVAGPQGWGGVDLPELARRRGLPPDRLVLLGRVTDAELTVVLHGAAVVVVPSLAEGFGLPLLEAMAAGVPVVHSDAPALIEVAAGTGFLARRQDPVALVGALRSVFADPARTAAKVAKAQLRASTYSWQRAAQLVWNVHLELYQNRLIGLR
ncbi:MAG TPA: glycosyltransferase family 1 protein [Pseudonocardiaceae bacterium]|nr:glycosyltransferase family 1 protein [Pseudonocardiaceae bacterium]